MKQDAAFEIASRIAARQRRCVSRTQLIDASVTPKELFGLRRRKMLVDVFRGVYVLGTATLTHEEFLQASILHAGPQAFLTHRCGLENRALLPVRPGHATVTTRRGNVASPVRTKLRMAHGRFGTLTVVESSPSTRLRTELVNGFETTLLPRTLVDAAGEHGARVLERAWKEAEFQCVLDADAIWAELQRGERRAGAALLRARIERAAPLTRPGMDVRSRDGELRFLELVRAAGLPEPEVNVRLVIGRQVYFADFYWRALGFIVEVDGPQHEFEDHAESDAIRDLAFFSAGLTVVRFKTRRMKAARAASIKELLDAYAEQVRRVGSP